MDTNAVLDTVTTLAAAPTGLKLAVTNVGGDGKDINGDKASYAPGATNNYLFKWTFDAGLHPSNETAKGKTPFSVK